MAEPTEDQDQGGPSMPEQLIGDPIISEPLVPRLRLHGPSRHRDPVDCRARHWQLGLIGIPWQGTLGPRAPAAYTNAGPHSGGRKIHGKSTPSASAEAPQ